MADLLEDEKKATDGLKIVDSFRAHVRSLLRDGKRSQHEDFQLLFRVFGKEKVTAIAKEELEKLNKEV